jgi:Uma2 family endonuclease
MVEIAQKIDTSAFWESELNMVEHARQHSLVGYLEQVLRWFYYKEKWFVTGNLDVLNDKITHPVAPDVMLFKGAVLTEAEIDDLSRWVIQLPHRPPPTVIIEIGSKETGKADVDEKPAIYRVLGAKEYFAFDPKKYWGKRKKHRLLGWRYSETGTVELYPDEYGRIWSEELQSWLVIEVSYLRLYDAEGNMRLTKDEALEVQTAFIEAEKQIIQEQLRQAQAEVNYLRLYDAEGNMRLTKDEALEGQTAFIEAEKQIIQEQLRQAQAENERLEAIIAKLREQGIDPDKF